MRRTTRSNNIFVTPITQPDGTTRPVISSASLNDQSVRVNDHGNSGALFLLMTLVENQTFRDQPGVGPAVIAKMCVDVWKHMIGNLILGTNTPDQTDSIGHYAIALRRPVSIFKRIKMNPFVIVDAAMRGQEDVVLNILSADSSYLLTRATVENSVGMEYEVTALQAAVMANDVQLIERMKEHFECLRTNLEGKPIDGLAEMKGQVIAIYKKSLQRYFDLTEEKIEKLNVEVETTTAEITELEKTISTLSAEKYKKTSDWDALQSARETLSAKNKALGAATEALSNAKRHSAQYLETVRDTTDPNYLEKLIQTHDRAQTRNKFDFEPYIKAICDIDSNDPLQKQQLDDVVALIDAATPKETEAVAKRTGVFHTEIGFTDKDGRVYTREEVQSLPFNQLTLVQKLNRFREKFTEHMQQEMIFNPNHILEGLKQHDRTLHEVRDPSYAKNAVIFSLLVGWAQRKAAEPVKQDIRQGAGYLTWGGESRTRQSGFNTRNNTTRSIDQNSIVDVSISSPGVIDG